MRDTLTECAIYKHHHPYPGHLGACPWCELERTKAADREERERERKRRHDEAAAGATPLGGGLPPTPPRTPERPAPPRREPRTTVAKSTAGSPPPRKKPATSAPAQPRPATWAGRLWFVPTVVPLFGPPVSWTYAAAKARSAIYLGWAACYWLLFGVGVFGGVLISSKAQQNSSQLGTPEILLVSLWLVSLVHTFAKAHRVRTAIATHEAAKAASRPRVWANLWWLPTLIPFVGPFVSWTYAAVKTRNARYRRWAWTYSILVVYLILALAAAALFGTNWVKLSGTSKIAEDVFGYIIWFGPALHAFVRRKEVSRALAARRLRP
jgi:hypothetical protein